MAVAALEQVHEADARVALEHCQQVVDALGDRDFFFDDLVNQVFGHRVEHVLVHSQQVEERHGLELGRLLNAVARPSRVTGTKYNQVSNEFYNAVHSVLSGKEDAASSLADLERTLTRISRRGKW